MAVPGIVIQATKSLFCLRQAFKSNDCGVVTGFGGTIVAVGQSEHAGVALGIGVVDMGSPVGSGDTSSTSGSSSGIAVDTGVDVASTRARSASTRTGSVALAGLNWSTIAAYS